MQQIAADETKILCKNTLFSSIIVFWYLAYYAV